MKRSKSLFCILSVIIGLFIWFNCISGFKYDSHISFSLLFVGIFVVTLGLFLSHLIYAFSLKTSKTKENILIWRQTSLLIALIMIGLDIFLYALDYYSFFLLFLFGYAAIIKYLLCYRKLLKN